MPELNEGLTERVGKFYYSFEKRVSYGFADIQRAPNSEFQVMHRNFMQSTGISNTNTSYSGGLLPHLMYPCLSQTNHVFWFKKSIGYWFL
jgi:hypothetical protein